MSLLVYRKIAQMKISPTCFFEKRFGEHWYEAGSLQCSGVGLQSCWHLVECVNSVLIHWSIWWALPNTTMDQINVCNNHYQCRQLRSIVGVGLSPGRWPLRTRTTKGPHDLFHVNLGASRPRLHRWGVRGIAIWAGSGGVDEKKLQ